MPASSELALVNNHNLLPSAVLAERYEIERLLGRGGMATVYLARDRKHDRRVAIKVVDPEVAQSVGSERFLREIETAAKLTHPHILPLHDSGAADGALYYVMPYVAGETLRDRLRSERQLPLADAIRITCEVASALDYAHRQQVLHRDIKPENILLEDGHAILADFGIARAVGPAADAGMTATGVTLGTPTYMSPEQASGDSRLDGRSDIYSLACVLYEMLAGEPPFTGPTAQAIIAKRLSGSPSRIRPLRPSVPLTLEHVLLRALDRTPADRFSTAGQFREALADCVRSVEPEPRVRTVNRPLVAMVAAAALLVTLGAGWTLRDTWRGAPSATTIAVLPFVNESPNPEHAYLATGLADALIGDLVGVPQLRVVSRMSVMRYGGGMGAATSAAAMPAMKGMGGMSFMDEPVRGNMPGSSAAGSAMEMSARKSLPEIARELGADVLLQGRVSRGDDTIRITASLIRSEPLQTMWHRSFSRPAHELVDLQRDLAGAIVRAVRGEAVPAAPVAEPRRYDSAAHEAYLKGSYYQAHWKLPQAVEAFERAVQLDANHAAAQAGLARAYYFLGFFGDIPASVGLAGMRRAAMAALERDPLMAEAHAQLALVKMLQDWDWSGAEGHFQRALEISPGHAQIRHDYAHFLLGQGRHRESTEQTRQAIALDPVNPMLTSCLGWHSLFDAQYGEAARLATESLALMPDHWAQVVLGWALLGQGRHDEALGAFREAGRLKESAFTAASLGHALAIAGREAEARQILHALLGRMEREYVSPYDVATVYAGLGEADGAFRWLRRAAEERSMFIVHVGWDTRFDRVRSDPRLADLTAREMRLPAPRFAVLTAVDRRGM